MAKLNGGALHIEGSKNINLRYENYSNNTVNYSKGGAALIQFSTNIHIYHSIFHNNSAYEGGSLSILASKN